jgi:hypothetical protein
MPMLRTNLRQAHLGFGSKSALIHHLKPSSSPMRIRRSGELPEKGSQETGKRNRFAKANLPGNPPHDCYAGPNKGYRQKCAGHFEAQSRRDHDRRLHAGDTGRGTVDSAGNLRGAYGVTKPWRRSKSLTPSDTKREIGVSVSC